MKIRWFAAGIAAVLITGGAATVAQRVITQKTRGVLPEKNDSAHADSRGPFDTSSKPLTSPLAATAISPPPPDLAATAAPSVHPVVLATTQTPTGPALPAEPAEVPPAEPLPTVVAEVEPTVAVTAAGPDAAEPAGSAEPPASDPALNLATDRGPATPSAASSTEASKGDPLELVESFVERNRKEAESSIQALATEAENLKARLAKVEAALVRWQNFSRALNADQPAAHATEPPAARANWKRSEPESLDRPVEGVTSEKTSPAKVDLPPPAPVTEVPPAASLPLPSDPPLPAPADPKPAELPPAPAPENPPAPQT